jgi:hypothetical protein
VEARFHTEPGLQPVRANPVRLARVLLIGLDRAVRAAEADAVGVVHFSVRPGGGHVRFEMGYGAPWDAGELGPLEELLGAERGRVSGSGEMLWVELPALTEAGA